MIISSPLAVMNRPAEGGGAEAPPLRQPPTTCNHCGTGQGRLSRCARCQNRWFCGKECQREDYKTHKHACKPPASSSGVSGASGASGASGGSGGSGGGAGGAYDPTVYQNPDPAKLGKKGKKGKQSGRKPAPPKPAVPTNRDYGEGDDCAICLSPITEPVRLQCGKYYLKF